MMNNAGTLTLAELRRKPHWSFSSIDALVNRCSLSWAFGHVYKAEPMFTPLPLAFGGAFHAALAFAFKRMQRGDAWSSRETGEVFTDLLRDRFFHAEPAIRLENGASTVELAAQGRRMIHAYLAQVDPEELVTGVSVPFSVHLMDASGERVPKPVIGEFDLVVERDNNPVIVDWKTSARKWPKNKSRTDLQPTCYLHAWKRMHGSHAEFRFDVVTKTKTPACEHHEARREPDDFTRLAETVRILDRMVDAEAFLPMDASWQCKSCPYALACQSWHRDRAATRVHFERPILELAA